MEHGVISHVAHILALDMWVACHDQVRVGLHAWEGRQEAD